MEQSESVASLSASPTAPASTKAARLCDLLGATLLLASAFLAASFAAENSDIWMHLAAGRALVQGDYHLGTDPFAYTTENASWVNHAWLFDAAVYSLHEFFGESALVVVKAALISLLTALLLGLCWRGPVRWLAAFLILIAVAAMSPYLLLRPTIVSLFFFGLTYIWLECRARSADAGNASVTWRQAVPLLALFVLWANLDEWFLLGPALVILWWLGTLFSSSELQTIATKPSAASDGDAATASPGSKRVSLLCIAGTGLLLAVLNPHHVRVFTLPALFESAREHEWIDDAGDRALWQSPLEWPRSAETPQRPARIAYAVLALAGLASFAGSAGRARLPRLVVFLVFFILTLLRSGTMPFFAVLAGPIAALNFQAARARTKAPGPVWIQSPLVSGLLRLVGVLAFVAGAAAAWTGWMRSLPGQPPRWNLVLDPSLETAARQLAAWRAEGKLAVDAHGLPTSPAAAYVLAWVCPAEKSFCDSRAHLFPPEIRADFAALRQALFEEFGKSEDSAKEFRRLVAKHRITHLVVDDEEDDARLAPGLVRLFGSRSWALHHLHGRTTIFAAREPAAGLAAPIVDPARRAWRPAAGDLAPPEGPGHDPEPRTWLDAFEKPVPARQADRGECFVWRIYFDSQRTPYARRTRAAWDYSMAASLAAFPAVEGTWPSLVPGALLRFTGLQIGQNVDRTDFGGALHAIAFNLRGRFEFRHDDGPPEAAILAIRAGRRALQPAPDDALTHFRLGEAYTRLWRGTRERFFSMEQLQRVRRWQTITALERALELDASLILAHALLAQLYSETDAYDFALEHVQAVLNLLETQAGTARGSGLAERRELWQKREKELARIVRDGQVAVRAQNVDALQRAQFARARGLPGEALQLLLKADDATRGREGFLLMLDLLLEAGRTRDLEALLSPDVEKALGEPIMRDWRLKLAIVNGDYAKVRELLDADVLGQFAGWNLPRTVPQVPLGLLLGEQLLNAGAGMPHVDMRFLVFRLNQLVMALRRGAEIAAVRGMLALEAGATEDARQDFQRTLEIFDDPQGPAGLARHYLKLTEKRDRQ